MIYKNFAAVPPGSICRPVKENNGDVFYLRMKEIYENEYLRYKTWSGKWYVDERATKRVKAFSKHADAKGKAKGESRK